jgi:hypothetical protein
MSSNFNPEKVVDFNIDYYEILGLQKGCLPIGNSKADQEKITDILNRAYKASAFKTHPDFAKSEEDKELLNEKFKLVVRAHTILSNPLYRNYYESEGQLRPISVEDGNAFEVDWSKIGTYREGMLEDTIGNEIFLKLSSRSEELGLIPAFKPSAEAHNFEWDWVVKDIEIKNNEATKLALSCVNDESDVLKLTNSDNIEESLPFKIYFCFPRAALHFLREENKTFKLGDEENAMEFSLPGTLKAAVYSDINLLETTSLSEALEYIKIGGKFEEDLQDLKNGNLIEKQKQIDADNNQSQWLSTDRIKELDAQKLRSILISKTFFTQKNEKAAELIDNLPDKVIRKKARYQR